MRTCDRLSQAIHEEHGDTMLGNILVAGIYQCFHNGDTGLDTRRYPVQYHEVINEQNAIGWIHLFRGRWTTSWKRVQYQWYRSNGVPHATQLAQKWVHRLGRIILEQWWKLWKLRNGERHGQDTIQEQQYKQVVLLSKLQELYSYRDRIMQVDNGLFPYASAQEHLESGQSVESLQDWCMDNGPAILASHSQAEKLGIAGTGNIQFYMMRQHTHVVDSARAEETNGS